VAARKTTRVEALVQVARAGLLTGSGERVSHDTLPLFYRQPLSSVGSR
jgi:hypothetical protein